MHATENTSWDVANENRYLVWKKGKATKVQHDDICLLLYMFLVYGITNAGLSE
jgi:hypothetical protein